mmetsp:Transcript_2273/g.7209  ORF Transcript_2273/g.7209 Transcript_2273/m.7209 type:complete len:384 (-) Transcript_2273:67-1218(-)
MVAVTVLGVSYSIAGNIRAKVLGQYSGIVTIVLNSVAYAVVYFPVLWWRRFRGIVPKAQVAWTYAWQRPDAASGGFWRRAGGWKYMCLGGLFDCMSQILLFTSQAYVPIFAQVIIHQMNVLYTSLWSMLLLRARYILIEALGVCISAVGGALTLLEVGSDPKGRGPSAYIFLQFLAGIPPAFVLKEKMFRSWELRGQGQQRETLVAGATEGPEGQLDVWCVNSAAALFQLLWVLPVGLVLAAAKKPEDETVLGFVGKASDCLLNAPGSGCHGAWQAYLVYITMDILFNVGVYTLLREGSALLTFLTIQITTPLTAVVALLHWPVIGAAKLSSADVICLLTVTVGALLFRQGNIIKERHRGRGARLCCFPIDGRRSMATASPCS